MNYTRDGFERIYWIPPTFLKAQDFQFCCAYKTELDRNFRKTSLTSQNYQVTINKARCLSFASNSNQCELKTHQNKTGDGPER